MTEQIKFIIETDTEHLKLFELAVNCLDIIAEQATALNHSAGLTPSEITIRLTDHFKKQVYEFDKQRYPKGYTTERAGGSVAAITLPRDTNQPERLVLVNSVPLCKEPSFVFKVLAHEIAHCLIGFARLPHGYPNGYHPRPTNWIQGVGFTACSVYEEFLADSLAKILFPFEKFEEELIRTDIMVVSQMYDNLNIHVYPAWKDEVQQYLTHRINRDSMLGKLSTAIQEGLTLSAHYRSAIENFNIDQADEIKRIAQHSGMLLYLTPFWNSLDSTLDDIINNSPLHNFAEREQNAFDIAIDAVYKIWKSLGITFELFPDDQIYVHVNEPLE